MARRKHWLTTARQVNRTAGIVLGDAQAVRRGRIGQRILNRLIGRMVGRGMRRVWR